MPTPYQGKTCIPPYRSHQSNSRIGIIAPLGHKAFCLLLREASQPSNSDLSPLIKTQLNQIADEYYSHTDHIDAVYTTLQSIAEQTPACQLLLTIPGIGVINATPIYSAIKYGEQFSSGREFSVWLGLTPRQASSGESFKSSGVTKRGDRYLRKQLIHGERAAISRCKNKDDRLSRWANQLIVRRGIQKACVAMAARMARVTLKYSDKPHHFEVFGLLYLTKRDRPYMSCLFFTSRNENQYRQ